MVTCAVMLSRSGLTRLVDWLERSGLVEQAQGERDPRQIYARVAAQWRRVVAGLARVRRRFLERRGANEKAQLARIWGSLVAPPARAA